MKHNSMHHPERQGNLTFHMANRLNLLSTLSSFPISLIEIESRFPNALVIEFLSHFVSSQCLIAAYLIGKRHEALYIGFPQPSKPQEQVVRLRAMGVWVRVMDINSDWCLRPIIVSNPGEILSKTILSY